MAVALGCAAACGRIGFEATTDDGATPPGPLSLRYDERPVYMLKTPIPPLVPMVSGSVSSAAASFSVMPDLPAGLELDPATGTIEGTPLATQAAAPYTVTRAASSASASTVITLRIADGFIVNSSADGTDGLPGDGACETLPQSAECTLRAAVTEINAGTGSRRLIYIPARTITLTSSLPDAVQSIDLVGESTAATILDANGVGPLISFGANDVTISLSYLTYRNGVGPISHGFEDNLVLSVDAVLVTGTDRFSDLPTIATLEMTDSSFESNTGTLVAFSGTTVTIDRCTFVDNTVNSEGMLQFIFGTVVVTNSTFMGNSGASSAILINNATATLVHNTFAANSASGAFRAGAVSQFSGGTSTWTNNLLANNVGATGNCTFSGTMSSLGGNLVYPAEIDTTPCNFDTATDPAPADPLLQPLADNGGPTRTMAPGTGSPAIDKGVSAGCAAIDQRWVPRPQGSGCDIGAVEGP
jgi:hypothetical protein